MPNQTGAKRSKAQRQLDVAAIGELWAEGWTQVEIMVWLGDNRPYTLSRLSIMKDCRAAEEVWRQRASDAIEARKSRELAKVDHTEREAWKAWRASKSECTKTEVSTQKGGKSNDTRSRITKETRDGNPAFLQAALQCIDRRCKILGIDAPTKTELSGPDGEPIPIQSRVEGPISQEHLDAMLLEKLMPKSDEPPQN